MNDTGTDAESRPNYYKGQLLQAEDFLAEQNFHINARRRHNLQLHGWGIVHGLVVTRESDRSVAISQGVAVDENGDEIVCAETRHVDLSSFSPNLQLRIGLIMKEEDGPEAARRSRVKFEPEIFISETSEMGPAVTLATVELDGEGKIAKITFEETRYVRSVAPASVTAEELHESLRKGWLRLPFRPHPMIRGPEKVEDTPPPFQVGATEAHSPKIEGKDKGAGGTMAIALTPNVRQITGLRIAGEISESELNVKLIMGGWNPSENRHFRKVILSERVRAPKRVKRADGVEITPFFHEFRIEDGAVDPEWHTLSFQLWSTATTSVSLVAVEFRY